jgi:hypothetical protein
MEFERLLNVAFAVGERVSEPEPELSRREEIGMRDLEFGLSGDPSPVFHGCKGAETAISGIHGSARDSLYEFTKSLRDLR